MENERSLFNLEIDAIGKSHLTDTAKWARFLAIAGLVSLVLILIGSLIITINNYNKSTDPFSPQVDRTADITGSIIAAILIVVLYFFPFYFLLKFANKMKAALAADDALSLNESFRNLKASFRYVGVLTIIFMALFIIGVLANLSGA